MTDSARHQVKVLMQKWKEERGRDRLNKQAKVAFEKLIFEKLMESEQKCGRCDRTHNLSLDHIVAERWLRMFGLDTDVDMIEDNYQLLCRPCNNFKSDNLDFAVPKTKEILTRLLKEI